MEYFVIRLKKWHKIGKISFIMEGLNRNTIVIGLISLVAISIFLFLVYSATNKAQSSNTVYKEANTVNKDDHIKWSSAKKHLLVEYGDLQCPACKSYHDFMKKEIEASPSGQPQVKKNITFIYRNYPLTNIHKHAMASAQAAEAAGRQNKYYEYSDILFDKQREWEKLNSVDDYFLKIAKELKLDEKKFKDDMDSSGVKDKIQKDMASGNALDVQGTPTFYLDGRKLEGISSFDDFKKLLADTAKK